MLGCAVEDVAYDDVVRLTFDVAGFEPEHIGASMAGVEAVAEEVGLPTPTPPGP